MSIEAHTGPVQLVRECWASRCRVEVLVRHSRGVRGVCHGTILAYDRHFNIVRYCVSNLAVIVDTPQVLSQVTEYFTPLRTRSNGGIVDEHKKRRPRKGMQKVQVHDITRHHKAMHDTIWHHKVVQ